MFFFFTHSYAAEVNYSKSANLPPLRISFPDLQNILNKAASLMATANSGVGSKLEREQVSLYEGGQRVTISGHAFNAERMRLPQAIDHLEYSAWASEPAPVRRIEISLQDFSRTLLVEGLSPDQVDALFSTLRDDLMSASSVIGGPFQRFFILYVFMGMLIINMFFTLIEWIKSKKRPSVPPLVFTVICLIIVLALPVNEIFEGFSAIPGDASFMVRHGAVISFLGLVFSFVGIIMSYLLSKSKTGECH